MSPSLVLRFVLIFLVIFVPLMSDAGKKKPPMSMMSMMQMPKPKPMKMKMMQMQMPKPKPMKMKMMQMKPMPAPKPMKMKMMKMKPMPAPKPKVSNDLSVIGLCLLFYNNLLYRK